MKQKFTKVKEYFKAHKKTAIILAILLIIILYYGYGKVFGKTAPTQYVLGAVRTGTISSAVTGTGQISGLNQLQIKPQGSGTITEVAVKEGDHVAAGQKIFVMDERSALNQISQAKGSVQSAQINYDKLVNGPTGLDRQSVELSYDNARTALMNKLNDTYTQADNLIRNSIDPFFINPTSYSPQFTPSYFDASSGTNQTFQVWDVNQTLVLNSERAEMTQLLSKWSAELSAMTPDNLEAVEKDSEAYLSKVKTLADNLGNAVNTLSADGTEYASRISSFKSTASSIRSSANSLVSGLNSSNQSFKTAQISYKQQVDPPTQDELALAKIQLDNAKNSLQNAYNAYDDNIVKAPFDGVIAQLNAKAGDVVGGVSSASGAAVAAVLITDQKVVNIPLNEVDAAKVKIGDKSFITFDALPNLNATGTVIQMDSVGTVTQGVVTYNTKVGIDTQSDSIKPGMSASATITTDSKEGVLVVPSSAIKTVGNRSVITIPNNSPTDSTASADLNATTTSRGSGKFSTYTGAVHTVPVQVGISNDTQTEIISGLNEGDVVVTRTITTNTTNSSARGTTSTTGNRPGGAMMFSGGAGAAGGLRRIGN